MAAKPHTTPAPPPGYAGKKRLRQPELDIGMVPHWPSTPVPMRLLVRVEMVEIYQIFCNPPMVNDPTRVKSTT